MPADGPVGERLLAAVVAAVVLGTVAVLAVWAAGGVPAADADPIGLDAADRFSAIDGIDATRVTVVERGPQSHRTVERVRLRPGTDQRRVVVTDGPQRRHELRVADGSTMWLYDTDTRNVTRFGLSGPDTDPDPGRRVQRLFNTLNVTDPDGSAVTRSPTVEPLPVVPRGRAVPAARAADAGTVWLSYNGTTTVAGRSAYVLRLASQEGTYEQTLYVDTERFFPLRRQTVWTDDGQRRAVTTTYRNVTYDPGLAASTFRFDPPTDATVRVEDTPERTAYGSVDALRRAANVTVPSPSVPPAYELTLAARTSGRVSGVDLEYGNETARVAVSKYDFTYPAEGGDEQVTVDGRQGTLTYGRPTTLSWNCEDYRYTVRGWGVSRDRLVAVARSVGCS